MKKLPMNPPAYGAFDMNQTARTSGIAIAGPTPVNYSLLDAGYAWPEEKAAPKRGIYRSFFKRLIDVTFVLLTLPFWVPVTLFCAIALWIEGGAPVYSQQRLGKNGRAFKIFKLRTMVRNADEVLKEYLANDPVMRLEWEDLQKIKNDPRVTPVGRFLRQTSLDELPQLWNVLKGDMSLVGPRPMMTDQAELYGDATAYNAVRPGITGLWQVSARNSSKFTYRNEVDAAYERSLSLKMDLTILVKTIGVVLNPTGH